MYSPKITVDLIPTLYQIAREMRIPMTKLVNKFIREKIEDYNMHRKNNSETSNEKR